MGTKKQGRHLEHITWRGGSSNDRINFDCFKKQGGNMTSEIEQELEENIKKMEVLIDRQKFTVGDAHTFLARYFNFLRKMQQLEKSKDMWKKKYLDLKAKEGY